MPRSFLEPEGTYLPNKRFAFTNITAEPFTSKWNGVPITVGPQETIEISDITPMPGICMGHNLAVKMTGELVDRIIQGEAKMEEVTYYKNNPAALPNAFRSYKNLNVGNPLARQPYEQQILKELSENEDIVSRQSSEKAFLEEIARGADQNRATEQSTEFADLTDYKKKKAEEVKAPKAAKVKRVKNEAVVPANAQAS